ncbi:hypothetical protein GF380_01135 [Candidatus Uhrbacteria bacterium]|nr:hypothetical protein [Candidatus Uhrbacteria bacterium]
MRIVRKLVLAGIALFVAIVGFFLLGEWLLSQNITEYTEEVQSVAQKNAVYIQQQKDRATWYRLKLDEMKSARDVAKLQQHIADIPKYARIWQALAWAVVVSVGVALFLFAAGSVIFALKFAQAHSELIAVTILGLRGRSKEELMTARENLRLQEAHLKYLAAHPETIIDAQQPIHLDVPSPVGTHSGQRALSEGHFSGPDIFLGYDEDDSAVLMPLEKLKSINVGGDPGSGKSNFMALIASQVRCYGGLVLGIDLHGNHEESLSGRVHGIADLPGWDICTESEGVPMMLNKILAELERRLKLKNVNGLPKVLIVFSEVIALYNDFQTAQKVHARVINEGRKVEMVPIADAQMWTREAVTSTGVRDNVHCFACHQMDRKQAQVFMGNKPKGVDALKAGEYVWKMKGQQQRHVYAPLLGKDDMSMLVSMAKSVNPLPEFEMPETDPAPLDMPGSRDVGKFKVIDGLKK